MLCMPKRPTRCCNARCIFIQLCRSLFRPCWVTSSRYNEKGEGARATIRGFRRALTGQVAAGLRYSKSYRHCGSEQAEDERSQAEHDNRAQRQRPRQHCERWQAHRRQGNEQCGRTSPTKSELLQDLDDWHFAGGGNDEERSGGSQRWSKPEGVTDVWRHHREEPCANHAEGKNQHGVFRDQSEGQAEKSAAPGEKEMSICLRRSAQRPRWTPIRRNETRSYIGKDKHERHADRQSERRPLPAEHETDEH